METSLDHLLLSKLCEDLDEEMVRVSGDRDGLVVAGANRRGHVPVPVYRLRLKPSLRSYLAGELDASLFSQRHCTSLSGP